MNNLKRRSVNPVTEGSQNGPSADTPLKTAWDYYNDDMKLIESDREKEWEENMNTILVVASLLAAVVSAFLIETTKLLQDDPTEILKAAVIHLSAQYNNSAIGPFQATSFRATTKDVAVNVLLLVSLALNLVAAVMAMLIKQWNREFDRGIRLITDPQRQAMRREFRVLGSDSWHLTEIVNLIPILVLLSVLFFILGVFIHLLSLHITPSLIFISVSGITLVVYIVTPLISIFDCQSPFRSAVSRLVYYLYTRLRTSLSIVPNHWEREDYFGFVRMSEKREQRHIDKSNMAMPVLQRLSNITEVSPRNWHRFYSMAQQLLSLPTGNATSELSNQQNWCSLLTKIESALIDKDGRGLFFMAVEKGDKNMLELLQGMPGISSVDRNGHNPLHIAAQTGRDVTWILHHMDNLNIDAKDSQGRTPLSLAAESNHLEVVQLLLVQNNVDPNSMDRRNGQTPLSLAASKGYKAVVQALLKHERISADIRDYSGRTPLSWAASNGHDTVTRLLLARQDVDANSKDDLYGQTPLSWAAQNGHEAVVLSLLAKRGLDVQAEDFDGRTPLSWAIRTEHYPIVWAILRWKGIIPYSDNDQAVEGPLLYAAKHGILEAAQILLSQRDVDVNVKDSDGRTPLCLASQNGRGAVVQMLLTRSDVHVNYKNDDGCAPLWWAALGGHEEVVSLLLSRQDIDVNTREHRGGRTPLFAAAMHGHTTIAERLLSMHDVDVDAKALFGTTPLYVAVENGHDSVVRLLLTHGGVNMDAKSDYGWSPFSLSLNKGHHSIIKRLLKYKGIRFHASENVTPFLWAAKNGARELVQLLITQKGVDVNEKDITGKTALFIAAENSQGEVVELLLARPDVDVNPKNTNGQTLLWWALLRDEEGLLKLLLTREDLNLEIRDHHGDTPLTWAVQARRDASVRLLLTHSDVDPNVKDQVHGKTPLIWAAERGYDSLVKLLLAREDVNLNSKDRSGSTPLIWAVLNGEITVIQLLLAQEGVDVNATDNEGRTSLMWAAEQERVEVIKLLLARKDLDANVKDLDGRTALSLAADRGYEEVLSLLK